MSGEKPLDKAQGAGVEVLPPLPDIDEVAPLSEKDSSCIAEMREVLARHEALSRFGITLLHEHFTVADDEVMVEFVDKDNRVLTTRPVKAAEHPAMNSVETSWRLDSQASLQRCERVCYRINGPDGQSVHDSHHVATG